MSARTVAMRAPSVKPPTRRPSVADRFGDSPGSLVTWYLGLIPHWMGAQPRLKVRLLLRTHQWIVERILAPEVNLTAAAVDLAPGGELTRALTGLVPAAEARRWKQYILVLIANLRYALLLPVSRRNEAWVRWLFLIPYSVKECGDMAAVEDELPARNTIPFSR